VLAAHDDPLNAVLDDVGSYLDASRALDDLKLELVRGGDGAGAQADTGAGSGCPVTVKPPG